MPEQPMIADPERTREIMAQYHLRPKKSLGQNFLTNQNVLADIVEAADLTKDDTVIEIGPGIGALTEYLARAAGHVVAYELDDRLLPVLADTLAPYPNVTVIHQDILQADPAALAALAPADHGLKVVANLPYYVTTPILMHFLESGLPIERMVMMMQKEVADRITAGPGGKDYGSLSVAVQIRTAAKVAFTVSHTAFNPPPKVDSAVVVFDFLETPKVPAGDQAFFNQVVRASFAQRRKQIMNNLLNWYGRTPAKRVILTDVLSKAGVAPTDRAETVSIPEFITISRELSEKK
ncbi:16S rRNA (adenine(1518)-N(6)/adenine(1519)-N(6))-dimethyltransferase RsmA [Schleiferilactobacillus perolens]|jgi:16S rRNA (adenine1518-N6/adenine1519-N6)-dimethyltransferase|uniref:16S rRNA (adenine(1518)-N(6)/adenine(1519)-N(6))- dimethyltransferase RsmA n=1 Tax=Schleiferilactobacillus perolens TaxID=100468 RepID=UPI002351F823|nr:16S rRNA (adenine(1518)-N(6)/adenine(1519)-N(6))-dimethyltransferase RsmA [Schleiferilactobacillus perolens]MCI2172450.1 16S rRNA (adenine(1518)-N(6)/adenine(1519)-N(6))-dimethyltransferase RsmA [Schleiferilactobacillus perolens]